MQSKINRFISGEKLRVLDLFSGCGGLSLGFQRAGYDIIGSVELDKEAARSHALNFHKGHELFEEYAKSRNIEDTSPADLFKDLKINGAIDEQVDIIIGGPPCQAFTRIGRAKLREVKEDAIAFLNDTRSQLYKRYLEYVRELRPMAILMENVPDMLNYGGANIAEFVCADLEQYGYRCKYTLLNTAYFGLPQMRERMFLVAVHNTFNGEISFPVPTTFIELPRGYNGSRNVALKHIDLENPGHFENFRPDANLPVAVSAQDALSDLPVITEHLTTKMKRGIKKLNTEVPYLLCEPANAYQRLLRNWPEHSGGQGVTACVTRILPRDYPIFRIMEPGDQYPQAIARAEQLLAAKLAESGIAADPDSDEYKRIRKTIIPPYDAGKFPNKWRKMEPDMPSRTLMAHLGKDCYSHIHYDSVQARTITVREAARLQSFPDGFEFSGAMNAAFRQIGNAVPPLMAEKLATRILNLIQTAIPCQIPNCQMV
ncbi:DNA cytosine methyltransferase [Mucilaginibacter sp. dw_454]|uniref:DNA cytosine methyltransferase n=1 Tax=Mucilaginibacter sp. dw_454 TaxID=2720079 RepID=UPI001BD4B7BA|nr:DNA cytosine methyltransferase [Mucilaginibacter sp. dw_454]